MASNGYPQQGESTTPVTTTTSTSQPSGNTAQPPDQVGWYFVEQYYTILGKTPDQIGLFYNKRSSLVWGTEGEVQPMVQGRHEINERIKSLNFKDCKVRVTNVDSQASAGQGILIQVMGEMIIDQGPCKKFAQTFFLAEQPNGYFVLNDIFRYLKEEEEEGEEELLEENAEEDVNPEAEEAVPEPEPAIVKETPVEEPVQESEDVTVSTEVDVEPEPAKPEEPVPIAPAVPEIPAAVPTVEEITNGTSTVDEPQSEPVTEEPEVAPEPAEEALPSPTAPKVESATITPAPPTPVATPPPPQPVVEKPAPPAPVAAPPKPATWASLLGSNAKPAVPVAVLPPQATQAPPPASQPIQTQQTSTTATGTTPTSASSGQGWQNVPDSSRRQARPTSVATAGDLQTQAYIKNVTENVDINSLKEALMKFGTIKNFEHNKSRSCAFVEFDSAASFKAAKSAGPLRIGDQNIHVEERRGPNTRMNGPGGYGPRSPASGQRGGDRQGQGRGGFQRAEGRFEGRDGRDGGRGGSRGGSGRGFPPRSRGGATATS